MAEPIVFATTNGRSAGRPAALLPEYANRHGCISGATGTGKTVTLQKLAEGFSRLGVPVFLSDVKGDLSGIAKAGVPSAKTKARLAKTGVPEPAWEGNPVTFWDVFGEQGHPVRATVSDMGPLLIARLLQLNDTQEGVLNAVFKIADDNGLLLLDMKDLRSMLSYVGSNAKEFRPKYGNISSASIGAIQRGLLALESQGGDKFFGEPMLDIGDLMQTVDGKGVVNILAADKLMLSPKLYGTFLLWILSELYENLPEVGDQEKPKLVFFFDEAHLLFKDAPAALMEKIELVVRLIRSKGVGVYFVTQNPLDIPETILGQLGNRVQHALRAFTPRDQKAVKTAADTMRPNRDLNIAAAITELGVGEALVSTLGEGGTPGITERCWIGCPGSQIGPVTKRERKAIMADSLVAGVYEEEVDRESAYEKLQSGVKPAAAETKAPAARTRTTAAASRSRAPAAEVKTPATRKTPAPAETEAAPAAPSEHEEESGVTDKLADGLKDILFGSTGPRGGRREGLLESMAKSAVRQAGNKIVRGILGSIMGGK